MNASFFFDNCETIKKRKIVSNDNSSQVVNLLRPFLLLLVIFNHCTGNVMGGANL